MGMILIILQLILFSTASAFSTHGSTGPEIPPTTSVSSGSKKYGRQGTASPKKAVHSSWPIGNTPTRASTPHYARRPSSIALAPSMSSFKQPAKEWDHDFASSPSNLHYMHHHARNKFNDFAPKPSYLLPPTSYSWQGPLISPVQSSFPSSTSGASPAPAPSPTTPSSHYIKPSHSPTISPLGSTLKKINHPPPSPVLKLPPPPPSEDCTSVTCTEPLTYTPPGSPCGCVWPIQVRLSLNVPLYTFFPLVSELAKEIAAGVSLYPSQVRIMGANAASQQQEKTIVIINLVPLGKKFEDSTVFSTYDKFWHRKVFIETSLFGAYEVIYVRYPGLPPSPPSATSSVGTIGDGPYPGHDNNGGTLKPLGVDVPRRKKDGHGRNMTLIIALSSATAFVLCIGVVWLLLLLCGGSACQSEQNPHDFGSAVTKPPGVMGSMMFGSRPSSTSMSFCSSMLTYTGSAKTFSISDIERATGNFDASRILGEGGFGLVYSGILDDGRKVAVKVLKRDDHHGSREFLAEVEMLSRLHHKNLVKLIGICIEGHIRCLVYELVPNGSLESHLHGVDKETAPLDWGARMKIALGAARGLSYLHEDSSPCVIHRDFKSSNILLEHDFTPKVSDFGLARTALEEGNKHISTHVMGTFGYLAPEYAMTGHLLVKSDVYSYGVVLLELLTGRKPVDLSQPPGQENLVAWARPLLTGREGLETIINPAIRSKAALDSMAKVAAIASMCVQPEVSHRPFMGEVVQALKLVCNEFNETKDPGSRSCSREDFSVDADSKISEVSGGLVGVLQTHCSFTDHDACFDTKLASTATDLGSMSMRSEGQGLGSFERRFSSGPLKAGRRNQYWRRLRGLHRGSVSEHGFAFKLWPGSH